MEVVKKNLIGQGLYSPDIIYIPDSNNQRFLGEYPWHPCYDNLEEWVEHEEWDRFKIPCKYHVPLFEYSWSTSNFSHMPDESSTFYMPSKKIVKEMQLYRDVSNPSNWFINDKLVFIDPSLNVDTQPCALIQKDIFSKWLYNNGYCLIWLIGGEKQLFTHNVEKFYGRLLYSGLYSMDGSGNITGKSWTENELPRKELM